LKINTYLHESVFSLSVGLTEEEVLKTNFLPFTTKYISYHLIRGSIDHMPFKTSDVELIYYHHKGEFLTFKGQWYILKLNQSFNGITHIYERDESIYQANKQIKLHMYKTDDKIFNKQYQIYTNNNKKTSQLLHYHFRERINLLERKHPGKLIFIFNQDDLHIGINNKTFRFHISLLEKINALHFMNCIEDFLLIKNILKYVKTMDKLSPYLQSEIVS